MLELLFIFLSLSVFAWVLVLRLQLKRERKNHGSNLAALRKKREAIEEFKHEVEKLRSRVTLDEENLRKERAVHEQMRDMLESDKFSIFAERKLVNESRDELIKKQQLGQLAIEQGQRQLDELRAMLETDARSFEIAREKLRLDAQTLQEERSMSEIQRVQLEKDRQDIEQMRKRLEEEAENLRKDRAALVNGVVAHDAPPSAEEERQDLNDPATEQQPASMVGEGETFDTEKVTGEEGSGNERNEDKAPEQSVVGANDVGTPSPAVPEYMDSSTDERLETDGARERQVEREMRGRPRDYEKHTRSDSGLRSREGLPRIGIVCRKWDWQWHIGLELPKELEDIDSLQVRQANEVVAVNDLWVLTNSDDPVVVQWFENEVEKCSELSIDKPNLVFKLESDLQKGRLVKTLSSGSYAVFVSETWQRDESASGPATVHPENAAWPGYKVHFFDFQAGENPSVAFRSENGSHQTVSEKLQVDLVGNQIADANENVGPLFGGSSPVLRSSSVRSFSQIKTIVLGEEGPQRGQWRTSFHWNERSYQQELPGELMARGANWYFVRFYDASDSLIGTLDFRFIPSLRSIQVNRLSNLNGKSITVIEFVHDSNCAIAPGDTMSSSAELTPSDCGTHATVHCDSSVDETSWLIQQDPGVQLIVKVDLSTLQWNLGEEMTPSSEWQTQSIPLSREMFRATSSKCLWVSFPRGIMPTQIMVGFSKGKARQYRIANRERLLRIYFREYSDADQIQRKEAAKFQMWPNSTEGSLGSKQEAKVIATIPQLLTTYQCIIDDCAFTADDLPKVYEHVEARHDKYRYLELVDNYNEFLTHYKDDVGTDWPKKIYRCASCNRYVIANNSLDRPTDAMSRHWIDEHTPREKHGFKIVTSVDEIRQEVITSLPKLYRCKHGDSYVEDRDVHDVWNHLLTAHRDDFVHINVMEDLSLVV